MTRNNRTIVTLTMLSLLAPGLSRLGHAQSIDVGPKTYTISGTVGVPGVALRGLPDSPVADENGFYSVRVPHGWSGIVTPAKQGYAFEPATKEYYSLTADFTSEDYTARVLTCVISGKAGVGGVTMRGLPGDPVTDREGSYKVTIEYGWVGRVTPVKEGYEFEPPSREYAAVTEGLTHEDYTANVFTYEISGSVGLPGVLMKGLPGNAISDADGSYSAMAPHGWTGKVTPEREGVRFAPAAREYRKVVADFPGQDYRVAAIRELVPPAVGAPEILVIPTGEVDVKSFAEIREDMQVMLQILREKLSEPRMILGVLYDYGDFFSGAGRNVEAFYLQDQAAVFVLRVEFPLSFSSASQVEDQRETQPAVDPVWQRARDKLYAPPAAPGYGARGRSVETSKMSFEQFKEELLTTLRHAANLRHIESNEMVILTILGQSDEGLASGFYGGGMGGMMGGMSGMGGMGGMGVYSSGGAAGFSGGGALYGGSRASGGGGLGMARRVAAAPGSTTVLTIQAKKADIDAFAKGELDLEQFRQKVKTFTY